MAGGIKAAVVPCLRCVGAVCRELEAIYLPPQFQIVFGLGPESSHT